MRTQNTALVPLFNRLELYPLLRAMNKNKKKSLQAGSSRTKIIITEKKKKQVSYFIRKERERARNGEKKNPVLFVFSSAQGEEKKNIQSGRAVNKFFSFIYFRYLVVACIEPAL